MVRPGMSDGRTFDTRPYQNQCELTSEEIRYNPDKMKQMNEERLKVEIVLPTICFDNLKIK